MRSLLVGSLVLPLYGVHAQDFPGSRGQGQGLRQGLRGALNGITGAVGNALNDGGPGGRGDGPRGGPFVDVNAEVAGLPVAAQLGGGDSPRTSGNTGIVPAALQGGGEANRFNGLGSGSQSNRFQGLSNDRGSGRKFGVNSFSTSFSPPLGKAYGYKKHHPEYPDSGSGPGYDHPPYHDDKDKHDYGGKYPQNDDNSGQSQYPAEEWCPGGTCDPPRKPHRPWPRPPKPHPPKPKNPCKYCGLVQEDPEDFEHRGHHCKKICKWVPDHKWPWHKGKDEHEDVHSLEDEPEEDDEVTRLTMASDLSWNNPDGTLVARRGLDDDDDDDDDDKKPGALRGFHYPKHDGDDDDDRDGELRHYPDIKGYKVTSSDGHESGDDEHPDYGYGKKHHDKPYKSKKCPKFCKKKCWKKCWKPDPKPPHPWPPYSPPHHEDRPPQVATAFVTSVVTVQGSEVTTVVTVDPPAAVQTIASPVEAAPLTPALTAEDILAAEALPGCPATCNPQSGLNRCDITTSCTSTGGKPFMCACRAGFRLDNTNAKDFLRQIHVNGQPFVYAAPGFSCNTPCSDNVCSEVLNRDFCVR